MYFTKFEIYEQLNAIRHRLESADNFLEGAFAHQIDFDTTVITVGRMLVDAMEMTDRLAEMLDETLV